MDLVVKNIKIKNAPRIPGLVFRSFRGESDYPVMAAIINAANQADGEEELARVEDIAVNYAHIQRSDPEKDMVFIEIEGQPVGYGRCMWDQEPDGKYLYSMFLHLAPEGRGKGLDRPVIQRQVYRFTIFR